MRLVMENIGFYFSSNDVPDYYDSYGFLPSVLPNFYDFLGTTMNYRQSTRLIQNPFSTQHVIYYIFKKCRGHSMDDIVNDFDKSRLNKNDEMVNNFVEKTFGTDQEVFDSSFLYLHIAKSLREIFNISK
jgi:predicted RND superfamily exporter protein